MTVRSGLLALGLTLCSAVVLLAGQGRTSPEPKAENRAPEFPQAAAKANIDGLVIFKAHVTAKGTVDEVTVLDVPKTGVGFEDAIRTAARTWHFDPATDNGLAVDSWYTAAIEFRLTLPLESARMYAKSSAEVWRAVKDWLKAAKIKTASIDDSHQLLTTRPIDVTTDRFGFGPSALDPALTSAQTEFDVFVSPYAEPARVYIESTTTAQILKAGGQVGSVYRFVDLRLTDWVLKQLSDRLGTNGIKIPVTGEQRLAAGRDLLGAAAGPCLAKFPDWDKTTKLSATPKRIRIVEPVYPSDSVHAHEQAKVTVTTTIGEDGYVHPETIEGSESPQILSAAFNAVARWRYSPLRIGKCSLPITLYVTVVFQLQK